ncbi:hypothetical protein HMPREF1880_01833 [Streptococcus agalactiae]|nr:glycerophosphoryl diester phosphodiesterase family protein [Streptococcus agalactiae CNCTC 10/84]KXA42457.1 hypothetical protein HMPREF1883_01331 [Streptococcus agalactiae]KXA47809.1 hypothetical protein HMPREF1880_01833 [Streptococcus agalactiae]KXA52217.1 hypothetical protein HMPREF1881_00691 [Streptococcus agalactiae]
MLSFLKNYFLCQVPNKNNYFLQDFKTNVSLTKFLRFYIII